MGMSIFFQQLINGIILGSVYALVALGLTLIYGILHVPNFAHGMIYMLGAYVSYFLVVDYQLNFFAAVGLSMIIVAGLGVVIERVFFRPVQGASPINAFIAALSLLIILENGAVLLWGAEFRKFPPLLDQQVSFWGISITLQRLLIAVTTVLLILVLQLFVQKTLVGRTIRAVGQDREAALLLGVSPNRVGSMVFALGSALAAAAGSLIGPIFLVHPHMGMAPLLKAFAVIILGGMGSIPGAILGGLILGMVEGLGAGYISTEYKDLFAFGTMVAVLSIKPSGLFGRAER
jgi:branched-chain amino acid transport system permease protein